MALGSTIRNRLVGFFVIISIVLIALPAMMDNDAERRQENNQAIAIDKNGAITDENGQLMSNFEPDYATLLEGDDGEGSSGELSIKGDVNQIQNQLPSASSGVLHSSSSANTTNSYIDSASPQSGGGEVLIGSVAQSNKVVDNKVKPQTEVLGKKPASNTAQNSHSKVEVLGSKTEPSKVTAKKDNTASDKVAPGSYSVQVGAYSKKEIADSMIVKLKQAGLQAFSRSVKINGNNMIRVYAGSGKNREALMPTLERVSKITGSKGMIVKVD